MRRHYYDRKTHKCNLCGMLMPEEAFEYHKKHETFICYAIEQRKKKEREEIENEMPKL